MAEIDDAALLALSEDRPEVAAHALLPLAVRAHPGAEDAITRACHAKSLRLREAAWTALAATAPTRAIAPLRAALDESERAEILLALVGSADDATLLLDRARRMPSVWRIEALGWAGSRDAVPALATFG